MRNKKNKIATITLIIVLLCLSTGTFYGCFKKDNELKTEYFRYDIVYSGRDGNYYVYIVGLTEEGAQLKNIVIPEEIDGMPVKYFRGNSSAPNVKKIIVSYNVRTINSIGLNNRGNFFVYDYPDGLKVLHVNCQYNRCTLMGGSFYIASAALESFQKNMANPGAAYSIANMQYLFNYDDSQNDGVFFIDDLDAGEELEIIPTTPKRDGYTFIGWFSEPECQNKIELNGYVKTDEEIVYLYAGWKENTI
ncbi:MAG: InlB B-repeat-containing protein [Christensenellales bacterium]